MELLIPMHVVPDALTAYLDFNKILTNASDQQSQDEICH